MTAAAHHRRYPPGSGPADDAWLDVLSGADPEAIAGPADGDPVEGAAGDAAAAHRAGLRALRQARALHEFHAQAGDEDSELAAAAGLRIASRLQAGLSAHRGGSGSRVSFVPPPAVIDHGEALAGADHVDLGEVEAAPAAPLFEPVHPTWASRRLTPTPRLDDPLESGPDQLADAALAADQEEDQRIDLGDDRPIDLDRSSDRRVADTGPDTLVSPGEGAGWADAQGAALPEAGQGTRGGHIDIDLAGSLVPAVSADPAARRRAGREAGAGSGRASAQVADEPWQGVAGGLNPGETRRGATSLHPLVNSAEIPSGLIRRRQARTLGWRTAAGLAVLGLLLGGVAWLDPAGWRADLDGADAAGGLAQAGAAPGGSAVPAGSRSVAMAAASPEGPPDARSAARQAPGASTATGEPAMVATNPAAARLQGLDKAQALALAGLEQGGPGAARAAARPGVEPGSAARRADRSAPDPATAAAPRGAVAAASAPGSASNPAPVLAAVPAVPSASVTRLREVPPLPRANPVEAIAARRAATLQPPATLATTVDVVEPASPAHDTGAAVTPSGSSPEASGAGRPRLAGARTDAGESGEAEWPREPGTSRRAVPPPPMLATPVPAGRAPLAGVFTSTAGASTAPAGPPAPAIPAQRAAGPVAASPLADAPARKAAADIPPAVAANPRVPAAAPAVPAPAPAPAPTTAPIPAPSPLAADGRSAAAAARPAIRPAWVVPRPQEALDRLRALCSLHDVKLVQRRVGEVWWLDAEVPAAQRSALQPGLAELGLQLPADGRLRLRLERGAP
ncbi:MAG: hypothetical protein RL722_2502 [Pseudomonadota bacterium]|jgi:hypothetical protein